MSSSSDNNSSPRRADALLESGVKALALLAGAIVVLIVVFLVIESGDALTEIGLFRFATDSSWHPGDGRFNLMPMVLGTLYATAGAVVLATPLGVASAVFARFYAPAWLGGIYTHMIRLMAGVPSVVYGFWGLVVLVPWLGQIKSPGTSLLAGILILALMILPTITLISKAAIESVDQSHLRGAAALGLSRSGTLREMVLPAARNGIFTAVLLGMGRAIGETMAILMVAGNVVQIPGSVFDPVRTLTANIALEMAFALGEHRSALFLSGLVLLSMVVALVYAADRLGDGRLYA